MARRATSTRSRQRSLKAWPARATARRSATLAHVLGSPGLADKSWVTQQYDSRVRGNTVLAMPGRMAACSASTRRPASHRARDRRQRQVLQARPVSGTKLALAEAYRNVAMSGATPVAVTNCLNFGSPEDPRLCGSSRCRPRPRRRLQDPGIPVTGETSASTTRPARAPSTPPGDRRLGVHADVRKRLAAGFAADGARVVLLGRTREEFGGSAWRMSFTSIWAAARPLSTWPPNGTWPLSSPPPPRQACLPAPTTSPTAAWLSPSRSPACEAAAAARSTSGTRRAFPRKRRRTSSRCCSASPRAARIVSVKARTRGRLRGLCATTRCPPPRLE